MVNALRHRVGQFFRALSPQVPEIELRDAVRTLAPQAWALFYRQEKQDQRHAVAVFGALRDAGHSDPDLLAAALLHDAGKSAAPCPAWVRALAVLMGQFSPRLLARLAAQEEPAPEAAGWRRALCAHVHHAEVGARWAHEAGCSRRTVSLIRRHREEIDRGETGEDELLAALLEADAVN
jgi:hypothetical protein